MNYRCLTCGFSQDFDPSNEELVVKCHPWMHGENKQECPACHDSIKRGGRKNGKLIIPIIGTPGVLQKESDIKDQLEKQDKDFYELTHGVASPAKKKVYKTKRLYGWTSDELEEIRLSKKDV